MADEGGASFWIPGLFGSLAATPQQPGWSLGNIYYHTSVSAGADVARAREFTLNRVPANVSLNANLNLNINATGDLGLVIPSYVFATPVLGGQASVPLVGVYGVVGTSLAGTLSGVVTGPFGNNVPFARSDTISDTTWGFGDVVPVFQLQWNAGVNNFMTYATGDIPVGAYQSTRLSNIGIGHGAIDAGGGYTYFNPQTGHEFSGVLGFTCNFKNTATQYQNGVDMHFDWGASQFLSKEVMVGLVGYIYKEIGCDSGSGDNVGCFQSQVFGIIPLIGLLFPVGDMQGYLNLKAYGEFAAANRPSGWNTWVIFSISPPAPGSASDDQADRQEVLGSTKLRLVGLLIIHCNTRGTGGTWSPSVLVPVMTTTEAVVPARSLMLSGTFSMRTITGMRCASRIHSKVGWTEGNCSKPVLPFCWAMPQPMLSTLPSKGVSG